MTSHRHSPSRPAERSSRDDYLDAARECILDVGWRRTTLTEVARRADVSRMTIYRTWADMPTLLGDLMTREWVELLARVRAEQDPSDPVTLIRRDVVAMVRELRASEFFVRIVELDPELVLPYLLARRGRSQDAVLAVVEQLVRSGQAEGAIRAGDPVLLSRAVVLAAQGYVLSVQTMVDDEVTEAALDEQLGRVVTGLLVP